MFYLKVQKYELLLPLKLFFCLINVEIYFVYFVDDLNVLNKVAASQILVPYTP